MKRLSIRQCALLFTGLWERHHDLEIALEPLVSQAYRAGLAAGRGQTTRNAKLTAAPHMLAVAGIQRRARPFLEAVAVRHGIAPASVLVRRGPGRRLPPVHELAWLLKRRAGMSYAEVAIACRRTNHTTAIAAVKRVEAAISGRPGLRDELLALAAGGRGDVLIAAVAQ